MAQRVGGTQATGRRVRKRAINWAAAVTAMAALLSAIAAMVTAANGVWHPPVPIPVLKTSVVWVGPTQVATQPNASTSPAPSDQGGAVPKPPVGPSTVANLGNGVTMWISGFYPSTEISFTIANNGQNPFILDLVPEDVTVYDDQQPPQAYSVADMTGNHQVINPHYSPPCNGCMNFTVDGAPVPTARRWTVNIKAVSGRRNVSIVYTLA
jgi:hypothetical protein